jgi:hypothetical protein
MKSISVQYQELKEGRITQHQFLRNARMLFPNFVTNHNSFDDSVKILKSKGLLNEGDAVKGTPDKAPSYDYPTQPGKYKKVVQKPEVDEQDGIYPATTLTDIPKEEVSKPIKSKNRPDGLEPAKDKDKKNEMKKIRIVKESKKNMIKEENTLSNTPDEQTFLRRLQQSPGLIQALKAVNMVGELDGLFELILNYSGLDKVSKQQIVTAVRKAIDADPNDKGSNFTSDAAEKKKPSQPTNPIDAARNALPNMRSKGPGAPNTLRETIKKMVNELLDEMGPAGMEAAGDPESEREMRSALIVRRNSDDYEGDLDAPPSGREAVSIIMDNFMDYISTNDIENPRLSDLDNVFSMFEDSVGKRYNDAVWSEVIYKLREKGYNLR